MTQAEILNLVADYMEKHLPAKYENLAESLIESITVEVPGVICVEFAPLLMRIHERRITEVLVDLSAEPRSHKNPTSDNET